MNSFTYRATRAFVKHLLEKQLEMAVMGETEGREDWSLQGFGMLRCYLPGDWRLNIWHKAFRVPNVSLIHDHPWHFESLIVSGELSNQRFSTSPMNWSDEFLKLKPSVSKNVYHCSELTPGVGGGLLRPFEQDIAAVDPQARAFNEALARRSSVKLVLTPLELERYSAGDFYSQRRDEVHLSDPADGCVTLNRRFDRTAVDVARVFWPWGQEWVSAEPRRANSVEVQLILTAALEQWKEEPDASER